MNVVGVVGVLFSLFLLVFLVYKGWHIIQASFLATAMIIITSGQAADFFSVMRNRFIGAPCTLESGGYSAPTGLLGFVSSYALLLISGALFGTIMGETGAAKSIATAISEKLGAKNAILITILAAAILTAGGISQFVCMFAVFPLAIHLFKEADIPRKYLIGAFFSGAVTFTVATLPGLPSAHNLAPIEYLDTTAMAAPITGIICAVFIFTANYLFLTISARKAKARGEHFLVNPVSDKIYLESQANGDLPPFGLSILAPVMAIVFCLLANYTIVPMGICAANDAVAYILILVTLYCVIVFHKFLPNITASLSKGISSGISPLILTGALVGFGSVVSGTPAYQNFMDFALNLNISPYYSAVASVNILAGITGSGLGGLRIFLESCSQHFLNLGVNPALFHRIAAMSCTGLDSLPHNGTIVTTYQVMGSSHKESYLTTFICTTLVTILAALLGATIATFASVF